MPKYNLALIPISNSEKVIKCANQFSQFADKYILGKNSLPHVTLYQFESDEASLKNIWKDVRKLWKEKSITLDFKDFSYITLDNKLFWISLIPNKHDELHRMHRLVAQILGKQIKNKYQK